MAVGRFGAGTLRTFDPSTHFPAGANSMNIPKPATAKSIKYEQLFEENGYVILKQFVPRLMCDYISENIKVLEASSYFDYGDPQVEKAYSAAAPALTETLLDIMTSILSETINCELYPTYSYLRIYMK